MIILCLGGAHCCWDDVAAAQELIGGRPYAWAACNDAGAEIDAELRLWASLHPEKFPRWTGERARRGYPPAQILVGNSGNKHGLRNVHRIVPRKWNGSSGLFVAQVARLELEFTRVILCGIPMDASPNRFRRRERRWEQHKQYRHSPEGKGGWIAAAADPDFGPFVRSMSGWSAEKLGQPTRQWLDEA